MIIIVVMIFIFYDSKEFVILVGIHDCIHSGQQTVDQKIKKIIHQIELIILYSIKRNIIEQIFFV